MKKYIYDKKGIKLIRVVEVTPKCGEDFCDSCGDCLRCYGNIDCCTTKDYKHFWVQYGEKNEK